MKPTNLNATRIKYNGNRWQTETATLEWTEDRIDSELDDLFDEDTEMVMLDKIFPKAEYTTKEVEDILGCFGEINNDPDEDDHISVTWFKSRRELL